MKGHMVRHFGAGGSVPIIEPLVIRDLLWSFTVITNQSIFAGSFYVILDNSIQVEVANLLLFLIARIFNWNGIKAEDGIFWAQSAARNANATLFGLGRKFAFFLRLFLGENLSFLLFCLGRGGIWRSFF